MNIFVDVDYDSLNKYKEELCGDKVEVIRNNDSVIVVLADGLGSGVKANILATLTSKILGTMLSMGSTLDEAVDTIASTLPVSDERGIAYSTFSILQIADDGECSLFEFDNPSVIRLSKGTHLDIEKNCREVHGKLINESKFYVSAEDTIILVSDGAVHAGVGASLDFGWRWENLRKYTEKIYKKGISAKNITKLILSACDNLYNNKPGDDTTVVTIKIRNHVNGNVIFGPPVDKNMDKLMVSKFMDGESIKIACGGTTALMVGRELNRSVVTSLQYIDPSIPPIAKIEGIDLTTEGILTMSKALEHVGKYASSDNTIEDFLDLNRKDGASTLAKLLVEECTSIHFFVGRAKNPAHQNPDLPLNLNLKLQLVDDMKKCLETLGKKVAVEYY